MQIETRELDYVINKFGRKRELKLTVLSNNNEVSISKEPADDTKPLTLIASYVNEENVKARKLHLTIHAKKKMPVEGRIKLKYIIP